MQATIRNSDRLVLQIGDSLGAAPAGAVNEMLDADTTTRVLTALAGAPSGGSVTLSADHATVNTVQPAATTRPKTVAEYRAEYVNPLTLAVRQQQIREILLGLRDWETVNV